MQTHAAPGLSPRAVYTHCTVGRGVRRSKGDETTGRQSRGTGEREGAERKGPEIRTRTWEENHSVGWQEQARPKTKPSGARWGVRRLKGTQERMRDEDGRKGPRRTREVRAGPHAPSTRTKGHWSSGLPPALLHSCSNICKHTRLWPTQSHSLGASRNMGRKTSPWPHASWVKTQGSSGCR